MLHRQYLCSNNYKSNNAVFTLALVSNADFTLTFLTSCPHFFWTKRTTIYVYLTVSNVGRKKTALPIRICPQFYEKLLILPVFHKHFDMCKLYLGAAQIWYIVKCILAEHGILFGYLVILSSRRHIAVDHASFLAVWLYVFVAGCTTLDWTKGKRQSMQQKRSQSPRPFQWRSIHTNDTMSVTKGISYQSYIIQLYLSKSSGPLQAHNNHLNRKF